MNKDRTILADKPWAKNLGWVIAVISLCLTVYTSFFFQKSSCLEYEIVSNTSILNENVELSSIRIMVDSVDVKQNNANVSIVEIKVANTGRSHLRREDYDRSEFGLKVENGYMIGCPEFTASSSDHLRICVKSHDFISDSSFINMPVLPLDSKDFYQLRCVFLHGNDADIGFIPYGKIIGQREIKVIDEDYAAEVKYVNLIPQGVMIHNKSKGGIKSEIKRRRESIFYYKRKEWEYEQEYRILRRAKNQADDEYLDITETTRIDV